MWAVRFGYDLLRVEDIEPADKYAKDIIENAVYMKKYDTCTECFFMIDLNDADIENAHIYIIDDDYYESIITNSYEELIYFYDKKHKDKPQQLSLF